MITLGLDTASALGGAALWGDQGLLGERLLDQPLQHAERLLPSLDELLDLCELDVSQIDRVSVNTGPGSFTGLRIGLATAKGLCQTLGVPLIGIPGPMAYRARAEGDRRVCVVLHDRRDQFYVQRFSEERPMAPTAVWTAEELLCRLAAVRSTEMVVGSGVPMLRDALQALSLRTDGRIRIGGPSLVDPSPATIARLGHVASSGDALYTLEPTYVEPLPMRAH
jgi:tRNA threonylcarbamoyladenosine biosynthesis protein TsaB